MTAALLARPDHLDEDLDAWDRIEIEWEKDVEALAALVVARLNFDEAKRFVDERTRRLDDAIDEACARYAELVEAVELAELAAVAVVQRRAAR